MTQGILVVVIASLYSIRHKHAEVLWREGEKGYRKVGEVARKVLDRRVMTPIQVEGWGDRKWHCCLVLHNALEGEF